MRRVLPLLLALFATACSGGNTAERPRARKPIDPPSVATLTLHADDGRVHIVTVPEKWQTSRCLVHVGPTGGSSIACMPPTDTPPAEREP